MSDTRIRRGGASRLSTGRKPSRPRTSRTQAQLNTLLAKLPVSPATVQRAMTWGIVGMALLAFWTAIRFLGLPAMAHMEMAELAARAGYEVEKVEVRGTRRMDEMRVYSIALGQVDRSMLNVDLGEVRQQIMRLSYVSDARVSRRLPDTLVVDIVERQPAAVWQNAGRLALVDASGVVLEPVSAGAMPNLPLLVGVDANRQTDRFSRLMEAAPALKPVVSGATWVGGRRWDLRFRSDEVLSLPEGDDAASAALVEFARLDGINHLLGRGILRFDMRDPDRLVLRMPKDRSPPMLVGQPRAGEGSPGQDQTPQAALASGEEG